MLTPLNIIFCESCGVGIEGPHYGARYLTVAMSCICYVVVVWIVPEAKILAWWSRQQSEARKVFFTVHDYVTAVHPWLMSLRGDILSAMGDVLDDEPLKEETPLLVKMAGRDVLSLVEKDD
jgi:hypothetical protein